MLESRAVTRTTVDPHPHAARANGAEPPLRDEGELLLPFVQQADLDWVPKLRYAVMREYLPTRGKFGVDMMRRTATVQANYDYSSEKGALRMLAVALKLAPLTTAIFANSPFVEGKVT